MALEEGCRGELPIFRFAQGENLLRPDQLTGLLCLITAGYKLTCPDLADPMDELIRAPLEDPSAQLPLDSLLEALRSDLRHALNSASPELTAYIHNTVIPFFQAKGALDLVDQLARDKKISSSSTH